MLLPGFECRAYLPGRSNEESVTHSRGPTRYPQNLESKPPVAFYRSFAEATLEDIDRVEFLAAKIRYSKVPEPGESV
jgi:hypothetical protein